MSVSDVLGLFLRWMYLGGCIWDAGRVILSYFLVVLHYTLVKFFCCKCPGLFHFCNCIFEVSVTQNCCDRSLQLWWNYSVSNHTSCYNSVFTDQRKSNA